MEDALWVPQWEETGPSRGGSSQKDQGEVWIFGNGSIVCWGLDEEAAHRLVKQVIDRPGIQVEPISEVEVEELEFVTDPTEYVFSALLLCIELIHPICRTTRLQGDLIILGNTPELSDPSSLPHPLPRSQLPKESIAARYAFSQALARSTALSALESSLDSYLVSVAGLPTALSTTGKPGLKRKELIMKLGQLLKFRQGVNLNRENFADTPDFYWGEPVLECERHFAYQWLKLLMFRIR